MKTSKFFLSTLIAAAAMTANAYADVVIETPVTFDFNADSLSGVSEDSFVVTDTSDLFSLTISTSGNAFGSGAWNSYDPTVSGETPEENLKSITGSNTLFGTAPETLQDFAMDFITAGDSKSSFITITFSGLTGGNAYNIGLLTGLPFEGSGAWNTVTMPNNNCSSSTPALGGGSIAVKNTVTGYDLSRVIADDSGNITLRINGSGSHTAVLNALAISSASATSYWMGREGADTWSDSGANFSNDLYGEAAVFGAGSDYLNVTVSGAVTGNQVDINDAYAYSIDSTSSLTVSSVTIEADGANSSAEFIDGTASASFANDGMVSITKTDVKSGSVAFSGTGTTTVTTLNLTGGDATFSGTGTTNVTNLSGSQTLSISGGTVAVGTTNVEKQAENFTGNISVGVGGTLQINGHDLFKWGNGTAAQDYKIIAQGAAGDGNAAKILINDILNNNGASFTFSRKFILNGNAEIASNGGSSFNTYGGTLEATGTNNTVSSTINMRNDFTVTVNKDAELLISGTIINHSEGTGKFIKAGDGKLTLSGTNTTTRAMEIQAGTVVAQGDSALGKGAVNITAGTLSLGGEKAAKVTNNVTMASGSKIEISGANAVTLGAVSKSDETGGSLIIASSGSLSLTGALVLNDVSLKSGATVSDFTVDFGTNGSITTSSHLNFGVTTSESLTVKISLTDEDVAAIIAGEYAGRTLMSASGDWGIWNFSDKNPTLTLVTDEVLRGAGWTSVGLVTDVDAIGVGQYGFLFTEGGHTDTLIFMTGGAIPEPSAFGLLAGIGALALVASRRRRRSR